MPSIRELPDSRSFDADLQHASVDIDFFVDGSDDPLLFGDPRIVEIYVLQHVPLFLYRLNRQGPGKYKSLGFGMWLVTVTYGQSIGESPEQQQTSKSPLSSSFSGTTAGGTRHVNQSYITRSASSTDGTDIGNGRDAAGNPVATSALIDNARAIGVSSDSVQGCDVHGPVFQWQVEQPFQTMNMEWLMALYTLTGCVNYYQQFCGFEAGEVLYLGVDFKYGSNDKWQVTHKFESKPNRKKFDIVGAKNGWSVEMGVGGGGGGVYSTNPDGSGGGGGGDIPTVAGNGTAPITVPFVAGWDYMWVEYATRPVGIAPNTRMLQVPRKVFVEIVYPAGDFAIIFGPDAVNWVGGPRPPRMDNLGQDAKAAIWGLQGGPAPVGPGAPAGPAPGAPGPAGVGGGGGGFWDAVGWLFDGDGPWIPGAPK